MVLERSGNLVTHRRFNELPKLLRPTDLLVFNDSRVLPARLYGKRVDTGGKIELLLLRRDEPGIWWSLGKPSRSLAKCPELCFGNNLKAKVIELGENGLLRVQFNDELLVESVGKIPLPPYIRKELNDPERYQTIYAGREAGSVAAPTAGLHFSSELMDELGAENIDCAFVTLHVGLDTFRPITHDNPEDHRIHTEFWELSEKTAAVINAARTDGRRIIAVGTTTVRVLEQCALHAEQKGENELAPGCGWADLFILPGHEFRVVEALITNFHLPQSSLLMLVSAFAGRDSILNSYKIAIRNGYRFYSFGDAMLIV